MIAGGSNVITPMGIGGFAAMRALSTRNRAGRASRPFDGDRGFVCGEAPSSSGLEFAKARRGCAEIAG
jgi:3-oxoacyl-[acyl-carrier-protein] synthase II